MEGGVVSYLWHKHKCHDESGPNEEPDSKDSRESVLQATQCVQWEDGDGQDNAGDVYGGCNPLGVIQTLHLYLPGGKRQEQTTHLTNRIVKVSAARNVVYLPILLPLA